MTDSRTLNESNSSSPEQPEPYVSKSISFNPRFENKPKRVDLEFYVDHFEASYEARVFLNNPSANYSTPLELDEGYAGSIHIFGHGGKCIGDAGHCTVPKRRSFDLRLSHDLTPLYTHLTITKAFMYLLSKNIDSLIVSVVPIITEKTDLTDMKKFFKFKKIVLVTFD